MDNTPEIHNCKHRMPAKYLSASGGARCNSADHPYRHLCSGALVWQSVGVLSVDLLVQYVQVPE